MPSCLQNLISDVAIKNVILAKCTVEHHQLVVVRTVTKSCRFFYLDNFRSNIRISSTKKNKKSFGGRNITSAFLIPISSVALLYISTEAPIVNVGKLKAKQMIVLSFMKVGY